MPSMLRWSSPSTVGRVYESGQSLVVGLALAVDDYRSGCFYVTISLTELTVIAIASIGQVTRQFPDSWRKQFLPQIGRAAGSERQTLSGVDALANLVVELRHCDVWPARAGMSKSARMRWSDPALLVTFENLTECCGWTSVDSAVCVPGQVRRWSGARRRDSRARNSRK